MTDTFDYGTVVVSSRYNANEPLSNTRDTIYNCIRVGLEPKNSKELVSWEFHIVYRDHKNRIKRKCFDLNNYQVNIKYQGAMTVEL